MLRRILTGATVLSLLLLGLPAFAAGGPGGEARTSYDFEGDTIKTTTLTPDALEIAERATRDDGRFVTIRTGFADEVVRSASDL